MAKPLKEWSFHVRGPIPRHDLPHGHGRRGRPFVPDDVKAWRRRLADAFIKAGGMPPMAGQYMYVQYTYKFAGDDHADMDSLTHAAQDALTKDAFGIHDKEWQGEYTRDGRPARSSASETTRVTVALYDVVKELKDGQEGA